MSALFRRTIPVIAGAGLAVFLARPQRRPPPSASISSASAPVMVVLDASGSMTAADAPGSRIASGW